MRNRVSTIILLLSLHATCIVQAAGQQIHEEATRALATATKAQCYLDSDLLLKDVYDKYFASATQENIIDFCLPSTTSFAAQGAWNLIEPDMFVVDLDDRVKKGRLVWFMDFVEKKAGIVLPDWWKNTVFNRTLQLQVAVTIDPENDPAREFGPLPDPILAALEARKTGRSKLTWTRYGDTIVAATYDEAGDGGPVVCFDEATNKILWEIRSHDLLLGTVTGGYSIPFKLTLSAASNRVLLAGAGSYGFKLQELDATTGETTFFFSSGY